VRCLSSVVRVALARKTLVGSFAVVVSIAVLQCGVALADTVTTNFEGFTVCSPPAPVFDAACTVNGQGGWKSAVPGDIPSLPNGYDQQVVANADFLGSNAPASFGAQSLRLSNAYNPGLSTFPPEFFYQTYSTPTLDPAGDGLADTEYTAQFSFISTHPDAEQPGLAISVSPDNGEGGRMSYIGLTDTSAGIDVTFYDTDANGNFVGYDLATLPRDVEHTIKFWIKFNASPTPDLVRIYIDGNDVGQCFTTWKTFYQSTSQQVPVSDRLLFLSGGRTGNVPSLVGGGYLFDNVSTTTANGPGPPGCDLPIEKQANTRTVHPGGLVGYRITVRNHGRVAERNLLVCDNIPRETTFVSASPKLSRLGRRRCLLIARLRPGQRETLHLELRVNANAQPGVLDNTGDETPVQPPGEPPPVTVPPPTTGPDVPGTITKTPRPIGKATAPVKVLAKRVARPPRFTG
jgi:uncharacterized repeat protein (TIGR01451 family)